MSPRPLLFSASAVAAALLFVPAFASPPAPAGPSATPPPDRPVAVADAGFERGGSWSPAPGTRAAALGRGPGRTAGGRSLRLEHAGPTRSTILSEPVRLEVGRVYRLAGWIRTDAVWTDPLARYPTALPACIAMDSTPYTNCSAAVGGTRGWTRVEHLFVALTATDRVALHLGRNGDARGRAEFDDIELSELGDIHQFIPREAVRWAGRGFRYDDRGWIFVHIEGAPHTRGVQFGTLVADELVEYARKVSVEEDAGDPAGAWARMRRNADALFLRRYEPEFLEEMQGIADGAAHAGAKIHGRKVDLLDVVTLNSVIDLDYVGDALPVTPHALTGRSFLSAEEELKIPDGSHKCSALAATGPATADGRPVFAQLFMWSGYTGVHFNVVVDVVPATGNRLVYQTFPGGIHSGTDFYLNAAGLVIGETTVAQTPFDSSGSSQSNRIRKAAQYATSIDEFVGLMTPGNNGLYTNDWPLVDIKTNEAAIYLLGTHTAKLWRSTDQPPPFGSPGFLWANNNARDPGVRREYATQPGDAPYDPVFGAWDRDVAFRRWWRNEAGKIDLKSALAAFSSSPINRPHACDGKLTNGEMAERMVFLAHQGKTTLREKFPAAGSRRMPELPGAQPHLTHGWTAFSPPWIASQLAAARQRDLAAHTPPGTSAATADASTSKAPAAPAPEGAAAKVAAPAEGPAKTPEPDLKEVADRYTRPKDGLLWKGSVFPASDAESALASGGAAYWRILDGFGEKLPKNREALALALSDHATRWHWVVAHEHDLAPSSAVRSYESFAPYRVPRVKGTFLMHQLRLELGTARFLAGMRAVHERFREAPLTRAGFVEAFRSAAEADIAPLVAQWLDRTGLPELAAEARVEKAESGYRVVVSIAQRGTPWRLHGTLAVEVEGKELVRPLTLDGASTEVVVEVKERPLRVVVDPGAEIPLPRVHWQRLGNFSDDWTRTTIVHGSAQQVEAQRTLALRWQTTLADAISEDLPPVRSEADLSEAELGARDLLVQGPVADNPLAARLVAAWAADGIEIEAGRGWFRFRGTTYAKPGDGLLVSGRNPWSKDRGATLVLVNGVGQLHRMTRGYSAGLASWALYDGDEIKEQGYHRPPGLVLRPTVP